MFFFILALPSPPSPIFLFIGFPGETAFHPHRPVFASRDTLRSAVRGERTAERGYYYRRR